MATATRQHQQQFTIERAYEPEPALDASEEDKAIYVVARYAVQSDHYDGLYQQWIKPIFFLVGKQWVVWNQHSLTFWPSTDVPAWRQQPVTNWTFAIYRALMAKLRKQKPALEVVPPSGDSEDREAAKLGGAILEFLWRLLKHPHKVARAIGWILTTGNVALDVGWDPEAGELRPRSVLVEVLHPDQDAQPGETLDVPCACDEEGEPLRRTPAHAEDRALDGGDPYDTDAEPALEPIGEISFDIDDPMSYRLNPEATSVDDAEEMFIAKMWPTRKVCHEFDVNEDDIETGMSNTGGGESEDRADLDDLLSRVTAGAPDPFNAKASHIGSTRSEDGRRDRTLVIKYYRKPCEDYPDGRHWITAGGTKVWPKPDDAEYPDGEAPLPFGFWPPRVIVTDTPIPGQPQGLGVLSQVVPLNEKYNYMDGKIGEYHTTMAMGGVIWVAPEDRGIQITSEPGQVKVSKAYGDTGRHPIREQLTALPNAVYAERDLIAANLRAIGGVTEVDLSGKPEGVTAGRPMLVMQEASDASITPTLMAIEEALEEVGRRELAIAQRNYTEERTIKIRGSKGKWEFRSFTGADLSDGLDVRVQVGSSFPWLKSAQWDSKLSLLQALPQLVMNPDGTINREQLAKYLDAGPSGLSTFESDEDPDLVEIEREHAMFEAYDPTNPNSTNEIPQLAVWQNQAKHQDAHFEFMKRDYARFDRWGDAAKLAFMEHLQLTTEAVDRLATIAAGAAPPGAPDPMAEPTAPPPAGAPPAPPPVGPPLALMPNAGAGATKSPMPSQAPMRLTKGDAGR